MIKLIAVGRVKEKTHQAMVNEYLKRLTKYHKVELIEIAKSKFHDKEVEKIILDESKRILEKIKPNDYVVLLDLDGKNIDSNHLSKLIKTNLDIGMNIVFVIGGSHGVSEAFKQRSNFKWQLSKLTFPHQLVRLLLIEQIYRSFTILNNHPYHK